MNNEIREQVLGIVAGMRGEKRAAKSDDKHSDGWLARTGAAVTPGALVQAYTYPAVGRHISARSGLLPMYNAYGGDEAAARLVEAMKVDGVPLREFLADKGIALRSSMGFRGMGVGPAFVARERLTEDLLNSLVGSEGKNGAVLLGFKPTASRSAVEGITAHELGHAVRRSRGLLRPAAYRRSKLLASAIGSIGSLRTAYGDVGGDEASLWSAATGLASLPMLNEEIQASRLGSRLAGLRGLRRLSAFRGVPTYLAAATLPALTYAARRLINKASGSGK